MVILNSGGNGDQGNWTHLDEDKAEKVIKVLAKVICVMSRGA